MNETTTHIVTKKQLVPELRFTGFEKDWLCKKISKLLVEGRLGGNYENSESNNGIPVIKMGNLGRGEINLNKVQYLPESSEFNNEDVLLKGDLLFNTRNTLELVGKVSIWREELPFALYNSNLMRMKFNGEIESSNLFMNYYFNTKNSINQLRRFATGTTSVAAIYGKDLKSFDVSFPSLPEQQKIASFLSAVDEKIQQLSLKRELLEQYKKGVMQQLFSGKLRFKDESGKEYADWEEKRLEDFCTFFSGGTPTSTNQKFYSGTIPFIGSGNIYDSEVFSFISDEALNTSSAKIVEMGDLLYALYGANSGELAISKMKGAINQAILCIRNNECIEYLYYVLLINKEKIVSKFLQGGQGNLSAQIIKRLKYNFPSLPEQQKIANFLSNIDSKIESTTQQITQTQTFKKGLLQKMFI